MGYSESESLEKPSPIWKVVSVASIAAGVQFGWALQLSLLTPYVQLLGVPHMWSSFIWLCGPISGMIVQPIVGYTSDRLKTKYGRRKPFIAAGTALICMAVLLIGYAVDFGYAFGDRLDQKTKPRAVVLFVLGFWILDIANNMVQDPSRAFLADLSKHNQRRMRIGNAFFSFFMAVGNISGYAAGANAKLYHFLPFTKTPACDTYCANLKTCFFVDIVFLLVLVISALSTVSEPTAEDNIDHEDPFFEQVKAAFRSFGKPMWILFLVTALNWIAWFPFLMYNTDWVGTEVYGGSVDGKPQQRNLYDMGVRAGALGLMLTAASLGLMSLAVDPLSKLLGGSRYLWGIVNFVLSACLASTVWVTRKAEHGRNSMPTPYSPPKSDVKTATFALFAATGIPQAMFVALISGPLDEAFGGGNLPAFVLGAVSSALSGIFALTILPSPISKA
ncbi:hypothetical protein Droror1_Dr00009565 [Drosera rotundifolia]